MSKVLDRLRQDERGVAMVFVVFAMAILGVLAVALMELVTNETKRSGASVRSQTSFQAAEAGIDDFLAKLVDNRAYYLQYVHPAESTRRDTATGTTVGVTAACTSSSKPSPVNWSSGSTGLGREWTSPNGKDRWCELPGGFAYNLQITAPQTPGNLTDGIEIVSTGRKVGSTTDVRAIEVLVDPTSVADYQMLSASSVTYGNEATTTGKIYSAHDICHNGIARANLYADDSITCAPTYQNGAVGFNSATIPTPPSGTNFAALQVALIDVKRAADTGGINLDVFDNVAYHGWQLTFQSSGNILARSCVRSGGSDLADVAPVCGGGYTGTLTMPSNGAIYASKTIIISGPGASGNNGPSTVNGRVTVASNDDIVVAGNIDYVNPVACGCGDDVLGMIGLNSVYVADWAPNQLTWRGASLAETYQWRAWDCGSFSPRTNASPESNMTYYGSTITNGTTGNPDRGGSTGGGCMSSYDNRFYNYDATLLYLPPPWFPTIDTPYNVLLFREIPATL